MNFEQSQFRHNYPLALVPPADQDLFWALLQYWGQVDHEAQTEGRLALFHGLGATTAEHWYGAGVIAFEERRLAGIRAYLREIRAGFAAQGLDPDRVPELPRAPWTRTDWPKAQPAAEAALPIPAYLSA
jgi:hypothetical protein